MEIYDYLQFSRLTRTLSSHELINLEIPDPTVAKGLKWIDINRSLLDNGIGKPKSSPTAQARLEEFQQFSSVCYELGCSDQTPLQELYWYWREGHEVRSLQLRAFEEAGRGQLTFPIATHSVEISQALEDEMRSHAGASQLIEPDVPSRAVLRTVSIPCELREGNLYDQLIEKRVMTLSQYLYLHQQTRMQDKSWFLGSEVTQWQPGQSRYKVEWSDRVLGYVKTGHERSGKLGFAGPTRRVYADKESGLAYAIAEVFWLEQLRKALQSVELPLQDPDEPEFVRHLPLEEARH